MDNYIILELLILLVFVLFSGIRVASKRQRFALLKFKKFIGLKGPGMLYRFPFSLARWFRITIGDKGKLTDSNTGKFRKVEFPVESGGHIVIGADIRIEKFEKNTVYVRQAEQ